MKKFIFTLFAALLLGIMTSPFVVLAQDNPDEGFLIAVNEDETLSDEERFVRAKDGLEKALSLSLEKVASLTADLNNREFEDGSREAELKSVFLENLASYEVYYSESLTRAQYLDNLESVQALAVEIKEYRDLTYTPGIEKVVEFVLVFYSEDVIGKATERLNKVSEDIEKLEALGLIENGAFSGQIESISSSLLEADNLRIQAKDIILAVETGEPAGPVEESVDAAEQTAAQTDTLDVAEEPSPQALLEQSLNNVKSVYEAFLEISKSVKETLGLE